MDLYSPAKRTKKAPRPVLYDPISHIEREFRYEQGRVVPSPQSKGKFYQQNSFSSLPPIRPLGTSFSQQFKTFSTPNHASFAKTKVRDEIFNPITGVKVNVELGRKVIRSLGNQERWVAPPKEGRKVGEVQRMQVAYVSQFLI